MFNKHLIKWFGSFILLAAFTGQMAATAKNSTNSPLKSEVTPKDIVLIFDTSVSMAYETGYEDGSTLNVSDPDDDPSVCNLDNSCEPMASIKDSAIDYINMLDFPFDRVAIITMTSQTPGGTRTPQEILSLTANISNVIAAISDIRVFEPRECDGTDAPGVCLNHDNGVYYGTFCAIYENHSHHWFADPSSCPTSNIGGTLKLAAQSLTGSGNSGNQRLDAAWEVVALFGGPANATDTDSSYPNGYCPKNTYLIGYGQLPWCRDKYPGQYHDASDTVLYDNPANPGDDGNPEVISLYDADDYAHDMADELALLTSEGVTIHTIGFGEQIVRTTSSANGLAPGETLLKYISEEAGGPSINHGSYYFAPTDGSLYAIFYSIAKPGFIIPTLTFSPTATLSKTPTRTLTATPKTPTQTYTPTATRTVTVTSTATNTVTNTGTSTSTSTATTTNTPTMLTAMFKSQSAQDGWVLESAETSGNGGSLNSVSTLLHIGDDAARKQYRSILSFNTASLPDNAVITSVTLKLKQQGVTGGGNPVVTFQGFMADVKTGMFGTAPLALGDFKSTASKVVGPLSPTLTSGVYQLNLTPANTYINKLASGGGLTQIRLRFKLDDNNNALANFLKLYSGDAKVANQPELIVQYQIISPSNTATITSTITSTATGSLTFTPTLTPTATNTPNGSFTATITPTRTKTVTATPACSDC